MKLQLGVEITHISLNTDDTYLVVAYKSPGGNTLHFGVIDVRIIGDQVLNKIS